MSAAITILCLVAIIPVSGFFMLLKHRSRTKEYWETLAFENILARDPIKFCHKCGKELDRKIIAPAEPKYDGRNGCEVGQRIDKLCSTESCQNHVIVSEIPTGRKIGETKEIKLYEFVNFVKDRAAEAHCTTIGIGLFLLVICGIITLIFAAT